MKFPGALLLGALLGVSVLDAQAKAILGVDLGSLYMKVALVQRNAPLEIVTNLHSKRKTENMVLFDAGTRFYGADASSLLARKPLKTPSTMTVMLGRHNEHPTVQVLAERHYPIVPSYNETRSGVCLTVDGNEFTPEELVAMVLSHARDITTAYGQANVRDCVLTVPSFATQHERRALLDAAALADLNVLSLVDENTAAALNFGMDKVEEKPVTILFYNMGASALQVSVVRYLSYQHKDSKYSKERTVGGFEVLSKSWDATLGGSSFDHRITEFMVEEFQKQTGLDARENARAMTKLRLQANKVKHVLSANTDFPIYIDGLYKDQPFSTHISRAKLEELCHDLLLRSVQPIDDALKRANMTLQDLDAIELIGGGMRVPRVQEEIKKALGGEMELGMHINSDESMALGAAFHGANISTAFKVRHVGMADVNPFPISISLQDLEGDSEEWSKHATMFKSFGKTGVKKTIAFTHDKDVHCAIDYEESDVLPAGTQSSIERYNITGVSTFAKEMEEKGLGQPKVSLQFELSTSGVTQLVRAEAAVEEITTVTEEVEVEDDEENSENATVEEEAKAATEDKKDEKEDDSEAKEEGKKDEETAETKEGDADSSDEKKDENATEEAKPEPKKKKTKLVEKEKKTVHKRTLDVKTYHVGQVQPYSQDVMAESKFKLQELARKDKERMLLEESRNKVESYIYSIKNKLSDHEEEIAAVTTEKQREEIRKLAMDAEDWMYDDGYNADLATMEDKYSELSVPAEKIWFRMSEVEARPAAIDALKTKMGKVKDLMKKWETTMTQVTEEERTSVLDKVKEVETWIEDMVSKQSKADPAGDAVFTSDSVPLQSKPIETLVGKLSKKPKPKPPKKEENETKSENETKAEGNETMEEAKDEKKEEDKAEKDEKEEPVTADEL